MKIVHISDTHGLHRRIDFSKVEGEVLIHSGDFLTEGRDSGYKEFEFEAFIRWFSAQPFKHKVLVAGNHDWLCYDAYCQNLQLKQALIKSAGIHYLEDDSVVIDGVRFYGSPWQPEFFNWAYNLPRNSAQLQEKWQAIPDDTQVLITHTPPFGHCDLGGAQQISLGCELLRQRVDQLEHLKLHLFGHIHEAYGLKQTPSVSFSNGAYLNPRVCEDNYPPIIDLSTQGQQP